MGGWQRLWVLCSLLTAVGTPAFAGEGRALRPLQCAPVRAHEVPRLQSVEDEGPPSLAPSACVPCNQTPPAREAQACEVTSATPQQTERSRYDANGVLRDVLIHSLTSGYPEVHRQYDADGHLLSEEKQSFTGASVIETYRWSDGLQRQYANSQGYGQDWSYDAQRRVETWTQTYPWGQEVHHQYTYENDRLTRIDHQESGQTTGWTEYQYDGTGRLLGISSVLSADGSERVQVESREYNATGWLYSISRDDNDGFTSRETYDAMGRLLTTSSSGPYSDSQTGRLYDDAGRLLRLWENSSGRRSERSSTTGYLYDLAGRTSLEWVASWEEFFGKTSFTQQTSRSTYLCDSSLLYSTEVDGDGDGLVDSRCDYTRDALGRLLRVQCAPVRDPGAFTSRIEYQYDCAP